MAPVVHGLESRYADRIRFVYLDIDDPANAGYKAELGYAVQPHFFLLDGGGATVQSWRGAVPETEIEAAIERLLGDAGD